MSKIFKRRGGILIYILGVITLLSLVVSEFLVEVADELRYRSQVTSKEDMKAVAYSALQHTFGVLKDISDEEEGLHGYVEGWGKPLEFLPMEVDSDYQLSVEVLDETGKISLRRNIDEIWGRGFQSLGLSLADESLVRESIFNWMNTDPKEMYPPKGVTETTADASKQKDSTTSKSTGSNTAIRDVASFRELYTIEDTRELLFDEEGKATPLFYEIQKRFSVYHAEPVNVNTVAPELQGLFSEIGITVDPENPIKSFDDIGLDSGQAVNDVGIGFTAKILDIRIEVARASVKYYLNAIVEFVEQQEEGNADEEGEAVNKASDSKASDGRPSEFRILALTQGRSAIR